MRIKEWIMIISGLILFASLNGQPDFVPPMKIPPSLSANFGELRPDHYHSGIDLRTQGVTGKEVVACADGYVYLILISPVGFGKAIYIRHPFGLSTVYAHLDAFAPEIEEYAKIQQYRNKQFAITITPPQERLPVKKGQLIGYSGNTGGSTGPHLHFEVRKSAGEKPVDPLKYNFGITDNIRPVIERLAVYPASANANINGNRRRVILDIAGSNGSYRLPDGNILRIYGTAGFGIAAADYISDQPGRFGISSIEMVIDSVPWFTYDISEFSFSETRYINAHIDYEARIRNSMEIEKIFVLPNSKLSLYKNYMNNGLFDFTDGKEHKVTITVSDTRGNKSSLAFTVRPGEPQPDLPAARADSSKKIMPFGKENLFTAGGIKLTIPADALYDTLHFSWSSRRLNGRFLSPVHSIHNRYTPLHRAARLSLMPDSVPQGKPAGLVIVRVDDKGNRSSVGGSFSGGMITADIRAFGDYAVDYDTIPPVINANGMAIGADLSSSSGIRIFITDNLSGIKSYTGLIDGKWALFEYDAKNDLIFYRFDEKRITKGQKHRLELTVTDNCNNTSRLDREFFW